MAAQTPQQRADELAKWVAHIATEQIEILRVISDKATTKDVYQIIKDCINSELTELNLAKLIEDGEKLIEVNRDLERCLNVLEHAALLPCEQPNEHYKVCRSVVRELRLKRTAISQAMKNSK